MEDNKRIKISLKTAIIIVCIIVIFTIGIIAIINYFLKKDIDGNYIYNKKIGNIVIEYYEGYNLGTGDAISDKVPLNKIKLSSNDLKEISSLINNLTKVEYSEDSEDYGHMQYDYMCDNYKLVINYTFNIYIGEQYGKDEKNNYFKVPEGLYNKVLEIVQNYNENNLYKKINSKKITIISNQGVLEVTDEDQLNELSNYQYYVINSSDDFLKDEKIAYTLDLSDGRTIDIYYASVLSCIHYKNGSYEYVYTGNLEEDVDRIFKNSKVKINTSNVVSITVTYKGKQYIIDNQNKIEELLKEFKNLEYNDYNYTDYTIDENDIIIYVNNSKYIIPGNSSFGSRVYIDEDGKIYDVSGLYNSNLEAYFKELVKYNG